MPSKNMSTLYPIDSLHARLAERLVNYRHIMLICSLGVLLGSVLGLPKVLFTSDIHNFFYPDHEKKMQYDHLIEEFSSLNSLTYVLDFGKQEVYTKSSLKLLAELTDSIRDTPYAVRVKSLNNASYSVGVNNELLVDTLFSDPEALSDHDFSVRVNTAKNDPLIKDLLVSSKSNVVAVYAEVEWPSPYRLTELAEVIKFANQFKAETEKEYPGIQVYHIGEVVLENALMEASRKDMVELFPLMMLFGLFILLYFLRAFTLIACGFVVVIAAIVTVMGMSGWFGIVFDQTSTNIIFLVFIIGLADVVHVLMNYIEGVNQGEDRIKAMEKSLGINIRPIFLTSLTTGIGFLTLNSCDSPTFVNMGNLSALGVGLAFVMTLTILPALVLMLPNANTRSIPRLGDKMQRVANFAIYKKQRIFWFVLIFSGFSILCIPLNQLNDDVLKYFREDTSIRQSMSFFEKHLVNRQKIIFGIDSRRSGEVNDPEFMLRLEQFSGWLGQQPEVTRVFSYDTLLKRLNKNMNNEDFRWNKLPESKELAAQYLLLYQMGLTHDQSLDDLVNYNESATRVVVITRELLNHEILAFEYRCREWLASHFAEAKIDSSSDDVMLAKLSQDVKHSMIYGSILAVVLIALALWWGLSSFKYALVSLLPNALPAVVVYGLWGLFGSEVTMAVAVTFSISLGIIVDDTVHILSKYQMARNMGYSAERALESTFRSTGPALIITSLVIATGLLVQSQSDFGITSTIGMICAPIIVFALLFDFYFLPAVLLKLGDSRTA